MKLSWIIPCYNEEKRIEKTIREVDRYLSGKDFEYEIVAVDNNSKDKTAEVIGRLIPEIKGLRILMASEPGKGGAVRKGMLEVKGEIRLFSDADNSTAPGYFDKMLPLFESGCDVVISSRDAKDASGAGRDVKEPFWRELFGNAGNLVIQVFGVWGIWDTQNGFKAFTGSAAEKLFSRMRISGFAFDVEILALARTMGLKIGVIPILWKYDPDTRLNLGHYIAFFKDVFIIRWNFLRGAYARK